LLDNLTLGEVLSVNYDFEVLMKSKQNTIARDSLDSVKTFVGNLAKDMQSNPVFEEYMASKLDMMEADPTQYGIYSNMYKNILYVRHFLRKAAVICFIGIRIYTETSDACISSSSSSNPTAIQQAKLTQLDNLKQLLNDSTNIMLNLDTPVVSN
jgi:hypothetical protein